MFNSKKKNSISSDTPDNPMRQPGVRQVTEKEMRTAGHILCAYLKQTEASEMDLEYVNTRVNGVPMGSFKIIVTET